MKSVAKGLCRERVDEKSVNSNMSWFPLNSNSRIELPCERCNTVQSVCIPDRCIYNLWNDRLRTDRHTVRELYHGDMWSKLAIPMWMAPLACRPSSVFIRFSVFQVILHVINIQIKPLTSFNQRKSTASYKLQSINAFSQLMEMFQQNKITDDCNITCFSNTVSEKCLHW